MSKINMLFLVSVEAISTLTLKADLSLPLSNSNQPFSYIATAELLITSVLDTVEDLYLPLSQIASTASTNDL